MDDPVVDELVGVLGHERHLLENLVFRLVEARCLLATGEARFLGRAAADIDAAARAVRAVELRRAGVVCALRGDDLATIGVLARCIVDPWSTLLDDHRASLASLVAELEAALEEAHELAGKGLHGVRVARRPEPSGTPLLIGDHLGARWAPAPPPSRNRRERACSLPPRRAATPDELDDLDLEITAAGYRAVLRATDRMVLPSLVAFLA